MRVLVTGASGKLGSAVVRELVAQGDEVVGTDRVAPGKGAWPEGVRFVQTDLLDVGQVAYAMQGCGAVIHLGAVPAPYGLPDEVLFRNNTGATFATLQAASLLGIKRAAIASSGSAYGMAWSPRPLFPRYAPIDEAHPLMNHDAYGVGKEVDERVAEMFCRRDGMSVAALRFHWVATREEQQHAAENLRAHPEQGANGLWGYVDLRDAARACRLAIAAEPFGFGAARFKPGEYVVVRVVGGQMQTEVEPGRVQQPEKRGQGGLPLVSLIRRDHGDRDSGTFG